MGKGTMFVSFRSPSYAELKKNHCVLQQGGVCKNGNKAFSECSFEGCTYRRAVKYAIGLAEKGAISGWYIMPPQAMLPKYVAMKPIDFMELMVPLYHNTQDSDYFVRFCIGERGDSFWTLLERDVWRRHCSEKNVIPVEYSVEVDDKGEYSISEPIQLSVMDQYGIDVYTRIKMYIKPEPMSPGHFWGRYARSCFVIQCQCCSNIMGISNQAFALLHKSRRKLLCPYCLKGQFSLQMVQDKAKKYPFRYEFKGEENPLLPIRPDFIRDLLLDDSKKAPKDLPLFCTNGEKFPSDAEITIKAMLLPVLIGEKMVDAALHGLDVIGNKLMLRYFDKKDNFTEDEIDINKFDSV